MALSASTNATTRRAILALELLLFALLCFWLGRAIVTFMTPESVWTDEVSDVAPITTAATNPNKSYDFAFDPFNRDAGDQIIVEVEDVGEDAPETSLNLKLMGRRAHENGSAIIQTPDKKQGVYGIGDEIVKGATLKSVHPGHIVISRDGAIERLTFEKDDKSDLAKTPNPRTRTTRSASPAGVSALQAADFLRSINLAPVRKGTALTGFKITPKSSKVDLKQFGLRSGDVLTKIGKQDLTKGLGDLNSLTKQIGPNGVDVKILRNNREISVRIKL